MCLSVLVYAQKSEPEEPRNGVDPRGVVPKEDMKSSSGVPFRGERPTVILFHLKLVQQILNKIVRELAGPKHLSQWPRFPRGLGVNHGYQVTVVRWTAASPDPMRPVPEWEANFASWSKAYRKKCKSSHCRLIFLCQVSYFHCIWVLKVWLLSVF